MKITSPFVALVVSSLSTLAVGCERSDGASEPPPVATAASSLVAIDGASCTSLLAGQTALAGSVCATIEGDDVVVTYATSGGWTLSEAHLWAGLSLASMPQTATGNPKIGNFPYASGPLAAGTTELAVRVPLAVFGLTSSQTSCAPVTAYIVAHAVVTRPRADGTLETQTAFGAGTRLVAKGSWATSFTLALSCHAEDAGAPPDAASCETAFARSETASTCFLDSPLVDTSRWGWTNGPFGPGSYAFDLFAGAGQCDVTKGTRVGTVGFTYDGATAAVTYATLPGATLSETHLYVGAAPFPRDARGAFTVAPGQYGETHTLSSAKADRFTVAGLSGSVYVIAHAVTCGSP